MAPPTEHAHPIRPPAHPAAAIARRGLCDVPHAEPGFAALLDRAGAPVRRTGDVAAFDTGTGIAIFVGAQCGLHLLAWRVPGAASPLQAELVALDGDRALSAWHRILLPDDCGTGPSRAQTALAAFDAQGLKARFEFAWVRAAHGEWTLAAPVPARIARGGALEPVGGVAAGLWPNGCGRCLRYPLARQHASPQLNLCRRECLARAEPFRTAPGGL
jgi:hypothetical protein